MSGSERVNPEKGRELLESLWKEICNSGNTEELRFIENKELISKIRSILKGRTKSYKYALLTQVLAKALDGSVNTLALQKQAKVDAGKPFDARSFCRKAVVPFEKDSMKGILGSSEDPYVSKPLRHSVVSLDLLDHIKDKKGWEDLYDILSLIQDKNDREFTENVLRQILLELCRSYLKLREDSNALFVRGKTVTVNDLLGVISDFLSEPSEGARLQVIVYALIKTLNKRVHAFKEIRTSKSTVADEFAGKYSDIECFDEKGNLELGIAVTEYLDVRKLREELEKAHRKNVKRLIVVTWNLPESRKSRFVPLLDKYEQEGLKVTIEDVSHLVSFITTFFNNEIRADFIEKVGSSLKELGYIDHFERWVELLRERKLVEG